MSLWIAISSRPFTRSSCIVARRTSALHAVAVVTGMVANIRSRTKMGSHLSGIQGLKISFNHDGGGTFTHAPSGYAPDDVPLRGSMTKQEIRSVERCICPIAQLQGAAK